MTDTTLDDRSSDLKSVSMDVELENGPTNPTFMIIDERATANSISLNITDERKITVPVVDADEKRLNELGYRQEYRRVMSPFEQWAYTFDYTAPLGFITGYYGYIYTYGGPVTMFWGMLATFVGTQCMAAAVAEVASAFPTLGSVYYWVAQLVPKKHVPWSSWFMGWTYLIGSFAGTALNEYLLAQLVSSIILLNTGGAQDGGTTLQTYQVVLVTGGVFMFHFFVSIVNTKWLGRLSSSGAYFQVGSIVVVVITLLAVSPTFQSAKFVFTSFVNAPGEGISSPTMVVLLGLPYFQSIFTGFEVGSHVVEEVKTAATSAPRAMIRSVYTTGSLEVVLLTVMTLCIQNPDNILSSNTATGGGQASAATQIFYDVFHARYKSTRAAEIGASVLTFLAIISLFSGNITNVTLTARMAYAMARDVGFPFHKFLVKLSPKERIPINATIVTVIGSFVCILPTLGSDVAFTAITAVSTITAYIPYTIVLICRYAFHNNFVPGPFALGRWGAVIGGWGAFWGASMSILFCFPPSYPVNGVNFNYAAISLVGCLAGGYIYWILEGQKNFHGPRRNIDD